MVATVHRPDLRQCHMALINECYEILRKIIYKTERAHTLRPAVKITRIILDSRTISHLLDELQVILHPLLQTLCFQMLAYLIEILALGHHVVLDLADGLCTALFRSHKVAGRIYGNLLEFLHECTSQRINQRNLIDLITEKLDSYRMVSISDEYINGITLDSERTSLELCLRTAIQCVHQLIKQSRHTPLLSPFHLDSL